MRDSRVVGRGSRNAEADGVEGCLGRAGLIDDDDFEAWRIGCGRQCGGCGGCSGPGVEVFFGEASGFGLVDVTGEDERGVFGAVVGLPEIGDVVASDGFDAVGGADGTEAVGVVAVERAEAHAEHGGDGLVAFLEDGDEALFANALDFFGGEGWAFDDVGEEVEALLRCYC